MPVIATGLLDEEVYKPFVPFKLAPQPYKVLAEVIAIPTVLPAATAIQLVAAGPDTKTGEL